MIQDSIPGRNKRFFLPQIGAHSASYTMGTRVSFLELISWEVKLTTHVLLGVRPSMSGTWSLLLLYGFIAWTGTALLLPFVVCFVIVREP